MRLDKGNSGIYEFDNDQTFNNTKITSLKLDSVDP